MMLGIVGSVFVSQIFFYAGPGTVYAQEQNTDTERVETTSVDTILPALSQPEESDDVLSLTHLIEQISQKEEDLRMREEKIKHEMILIQALQHEVEKKIEEYNELLKKLDKYLQPLSTQKKKELKQLILAMNNMEPAKAAVALEKMEITTAVKIITQVDEKKAGKILNYVSAESAVRITEAISKIQ